MRNGDLKLPSAEEPGNSQMVLMDSNSLIILRGSFAVPLNSYNSGVFWFGYWFVFETVVLCVIQCSLELMTFLLQPPTCWDYRYVPPVPVITLTLGKIHKLLFSVGTFEGKTISKQREEQEQQVSLSGLITNQDLQLKSVLSLFRV